MQGRRPRVGIVGTGISGFGTAWLLGDTCEVELFEQGSRLGGHIHPIGVEDTSGNVVHVDTGFVGFKRSAYPNVHRLFELLGLEQIQYDCALTVFLERRALQFQRSEAHTLFGNQVPDACLKHYDRFRELLGMAKARGVSAFDNVSIAEFVARERCHSDLQEVFIVPDISTIWGFQPEDVLRMSIHNLFGSLLTAGRDVRRVAPSTRAYLDALLRACSACEVHCEAVTGVDLVDGAARVRTAGATHSFDAVVLAVHADQALRLLERPTSDQSRLLGSFEYLDTIAVMHSDATLLPPDRSRPTNFNYLELARGDRTTAMVTVDLNRLFGFASPEPCLLTTSKPALVDGGFIEDARIQHVTKNRHCLTTPRGVAAIGELDRLNERGPLYFCGSYFQPAPTHEAAFTSALRLAATLHANLGVTPGRWSSA